MNSLIGSKNIEADFTALLKRYPEILKCVPTLLAVRQSEIYAQDSEGAFLFDFNRINYSVEQYMKFMRKTGLLDLIANHLVNNLVDYVLGIETGLDSNGRKNRGGHQMEDLVEGFIKQTGAEYYKEMYITDIEKKWGVDLSAISAEGTSTKRWDFVVKTDKTIYVIETNFYGGGGSKLNETARSYKMIAEEARLQMMRITASETLRDAAMSGILKVMSQHTKQVIQSSSTALVQSNLSSIVHSTKTTKSQKQSKKC